jgi:hypothetical protein
MGITLAASTSWESKAFSAPCLKTKSKLFAEHVVTGVRPELVSSQQTKSILVCAQLDILTGEPFVWPKSQ